MKLPGLYQTFEEKWGKFQTCHIISDTHFGDMDLKENIPNRPNDDDFIKLINSKVGRADIILHLGDVGNIDCVRRLRAAHKVLICGNHDSGATNYKRQIITQQFFKKCYTKQQAMDLVKSMFPNCKYTIDEGDELVWEISADNMLFDEVYEGALIIGEKLILSHEPVDVPWLYNIHGHDHAGAKRPNHMNVCSDVIGYEPINFNQFLKAGHMSKIQTIHRETIDKATDRKKKRGGKKIGR